MNILVVDDDHLSRESVANFLSEQLMHDVVQAPSVREAISLFYINDFDVILTDLKMPGSGGLDLLKEVKNNKPGSKVIIMTGFGDLGSALEAFHEGATDYLLKPIDIEKLALLIDRLQKESGASDAEKNPQEMGATYISDSKEQKYMYGEHRVAKTEAGGMKNNIGVFSPVMKEIVDLCRVYHANRDVPILIHGETGTGKEIVAKFIHYGESRKNELPFVAVNCSAITPSLFESELFGYEEGAFTSAKKSGSSGKLEQAQTGTLFLDEIGDLPPEMQPKLLRVLQEKEFSRIGSGKSIKLDVRFVFATNRHLAAMIDDGTFRSDLYYRISTGNIFIPPLRERKEEIIPFTMFFMDKYAQKFKKRFRFIETKARTLLENYNWPGNIRELENSIERIILLNDEEHIKEQHLGFIRDPAGQSMVESGCVLEPGKIVLPAGSLSLYDIKNEIVRKAMRKFGNNKTKVAEYLGLTRSALRKYL